MVVTAVPHVPSTTKGSITHGLGTTKRSLPNFRMAPKGGRVRVICWRIAHGPFWKLHGWLHSYDWRFRRLMPFNNFPRWWCGLLSRLDGSGEEEGYWCE